MAAYPIAQAIKLVADVFYVLLLVRVVFSWLQPRRLHPILQRIERLSFVTTEPLLKPIRNFLLRYQAGAPIDFSPIVAYLVIKLVERLLIRALYSV